MLYPMMILQDEIIIKNPERELRIMMKIAEARSEDMIRKRKDTF